ncbi:MAG TPA: hypothetical protein PJ994_09670 [Tepidiformaceae bacterium]|nr:hypothetical protein [Tepidiformaceae bacterium]HMO96248.1 hypothetical protein [Tepidiformaceae bacterium]
MPRHRPGLGQGLQALVAPIRAEEDAPPLIPTAPVTTAAPAHWQYAVLRSRGKKRKDSTVTILSGDLLQRPSRKKLPRISQLVALGVLGASGWELVSVRKRTYFLKRPTPAV